MTSTSPSVQTYANGAVKLSPGSLFQLSHRTVVVTGGLGSLGTSLSCTLRHYGADVILLDMAPEPSSEQWVQLRPEINKDSHESTAIEYISCDVVDQKSVSKAFEQAESIARSPIRGLVTCAGISGNVPALDYPLEDFKRILDINVVGTFLCAQAAGRIMVKQQLPGSMVLIASMSGTNVNKGVTTSAYNSSKSAVLQLARNLAAEWGGLRHPIRVNTLSPGYIMTPMTMPTFTEHPELQTLWPKGNMLGRMSTVGEYGSSVVFMLSDGSSYMTASDLRVDAGHCAW